MKGVSQNVLVASVLRSGDGIRGVPLVLLRRRVFCSRVQQQLSLVSRLPKHTRLGRSVPVVSCTELSNGIQMREARLRTKSPSHCRSYFGTWRQLLMGELLSIRIITDWVKKKECAARVEFVGVDDALRQ